MTVEAAAVDLLPLSEAARRFGVSTRWLRDRIKERRLTRYDKSLGGSRPSFLVDPAELLALLKGDTPQASTRPRRRQRIGRPLRYL